MFIDGSLFEKIIVRIANNEDPGQTAPVQSALFASIGTVCIYRPFFQITNIPNFRILAVKRQY